MAYTTDASAVSDTHSNTAKTPAKPDNKPAKSSVMEYQQGFAAGAF